jgi:hypothetical protein
MSDENDCGSHPAFNPESLSTAQKKDEAGARSRVEKK